MFSTNNEGQLNLQTIRVSWLCTKKSTIPQCMQQPVAKIAAFFERCVALLPNFREHPPIYVLNHFTNHSIPEEKWSMLVCKIECGCFLIATAWFEKSTISLSKGPLNLAKPLSIKWHIHWNMWFTFESADSCFQSVSIPVRKCGKSLLLIPLMMQTLF